MAVVLQKLIDRVGISWTLYIFGLLVLSTGLPAAWLIRERAPSTHGRVLDFDMFRNLPFAFMSLAGAIVNFALLVPPFFLPLLARSLGLSATTGAGLVAGFNACSAVGHFVSGYTCDRLGPMNTLVVIMQLNAVR